MNPPEFTSENDAGDENALHQSIDKILFLKTFTTGRDSLSHSLHA